MQTCSHCITFHRDVWREGDADGLYQELLNMGYEVESNHLSGNREKLEWVSNHNNEAKYVGYFPCLMKFKGNNTVPSVFGAKTVESNRKPSFDGVSKFDRDSILTWVKRD